MEPGKIYRLSAPSDGVVGGEIVRFPVGLPVKLVAEHDDYYEVIEPYGDTVLFPKTAVWRLGREMSPKELFAEGKANVGKLPPLLVPFPNDEIAQKAWYEYSHPEEFRWYIDDLRKKLKSDVFCDWEPGWSESDIRFILEAAIALLTDHRGEPRYDDELINAICDIALNLFADDDPGWTKRVPESVARHIATLVVSIVEQLLTLDFVVKSGGKWDLRNKMFRLETYDGQIVEVRGEESAA